VSNSVWPCGGSLPKRSVISSSSASMLGLVGRGQALVQVQPHVHVAAVGVGQQGGACRLISVVPPNRPAGGAQQVGLAPGLQRAHGLGQHVVVELEADLHHVAALVLAQHLAGAADLQVVHRQVEARAQLLHVLDGLQPLRGLLGQAFDVGHQQVGVGLVVAAADAPAQLVQLRQAELVGAADDDGVGVGTSMPVSMMVEHSSRLWRWATKSRITCSSSRSGIWPWATAMRASGSSSASFSRAVLDGLDLVVQEVDLPAALELAQHRLADGAVAAFVAHEGLDRQPALRRGGDDRQVAQAFQRHAQRARDRRGGQRQHVDLGAQGLHRLLVAHAEAVLLVDDQQAQALELDVG
jgi:hypothetical protein